MFLEFGTLRENLADHAASQLRCGKPFPLLFINRFAICILQEYTDVSPQLIISHGRFQTLRRTLHPRRRWEHTDLRQKQHVLINRTELLD